MKQQQATWEADDWKPRKGPHRLAAAKRRATWVTIKPDNPFGYSSVCVYGGEDRVFVKVNGELRQLPSNASWVCHCEDGLHSVEILRPLVAYEVASVVFSRKDLVRELVTISGEMTPRPLISKSIGRPLATLEAHVAALTR